jgi:hypothetical protein
MCGEYSKYGERRDAYRGLVGKPEGKRPFERPRHRSEKIFWKWDEGPLTGLI